MSVNLAPIHKCSKLLSVTAVWCKFDLFCCRSNHSATSYCLLGGLLYEGNPIEKYTFCRKCLSILVLMLVFLHIHHMHLNIFLSVNEFFFIPTSKNDDSDCTSYILVNMQNSISIT